MAMDLDLAVVWQTLPFLLQALSVTLWLTVAGSVLALALGQALALMRLSYRPWLTVPATAYIDFFRGTPLLIQLFALYFGAPQFGIDLPPVTAGILGLGLNGAAYVAEILRAGIQAVPAGLWEAGRAMGMGDITLARRVVLPLAYRVAMPPLGGALVSLLKDTSLVSTITVVELTRQTQTAIGATFRAVELYGAAALLYFALTYPLIKAVDRMERRLAKGEAT
jgi:His/Glu/Gln/Arg/opine family amino acid ABC transporter permease subunit